MRVYQFSFEELSMILIQKPHRVGEQDPEEKKDMDNNEDEHHDGEVDPSGGHV